MRTTVLLWVAATFLEATILSAQEGVVFAYAIITSGVKYGTLAVLAWPVWRMSGRLLAARRGAFLVTHLVAGATVVLVWQAIYFGFLYLQLGSLATLGLEGTAWWQALNAVLTYTVVAAGITAAQASRRLRAQQARATELALVAREAELTSLKAQLRPHFLFNTLNSIYALVQTQPDRAQEMIALLADLLRETLEIGEDALVPLRTELHTAETYLEIEKMRFGERLHVGMELTPGTDQMMVPPLILQPLVENAVKHGIGRMPEGGSVDIRAVIVGDVLELTVRDTGPGCGADVADDANGRGLEITRRRLQAMYGAVSSLVLRNVAPSGCEVHLRIPIQVPPSSDGRDKREDV